MGQLKAVCRWKLLSLIQVANNVFWKSRYEGAFRARIRESGRAPWLETVAVQGSHHIYGKIVRLSIPIHGNRPLKTGLLHHLAKLADIPDVELE